jgi:hypothetical protein
VVSTPVAHHTWVWEPKLKDVCDLGVMFVARVTRDHLAVVWR